MVFESTSAEMTFEFGKKIGSLVKPGDIICLDGNLGVGKTVFTQGVAAGLNIDEPVCSPTFTLIQEYHEGRIPLYHFDVYRIDGPWDMDDLGYEEYFYGEGVTVVEWAKIIEPLLPDEYLAMEILVVPEGRELCFIPHGIRYERLIEELTGCDYSKYR